MNFRSFMTPLVAAGLVMFSAAATVAAPVHYDESVSGDINGSQFMSLDFGTNTVTGSSHFVFNGGSADSDHDSFPFFIPNGGVLKNVSLSFSVTDLLPNTFSLFAQYRLDQYPFPFTNLDIAPQTSFLMDTSPVELFDPALPLTEGLYYLGLNLIGAGGPSQVGGGSWSYTFTFDVVQVPEPGAVALCAMGIALLAGTQRRRSKSA